MLNVGDAAEADCIFKTLAEKGTVQLPVQEPFWALRFGMLVDQFGHALDQLREPGLMLC